MKIHVHADAGSGPVQTTVELPDDRTVTDLRAAFFQNKSVASQLSASSSHKMAFYKENGTLLNDRQTIERCGLMEGETVFLKRVGGGAAEASEGQSRPYFQIEIRVDAKKAVQLRSCSREDVQA